MSKVITDLCHEISSSPIESYGGKAANLIDLDKEGFLIPRTFLLSTKEIGNFFSRESQERIQTLLRQATSTPTVTILEQVSAEIQAIIDGLEIPQTIVQAVQRQLSSDIRYAVRSSSVLEDGRTYSFAGQSESYLNISKTHVAEAIRSCLRSLYTTRILHYCSQHRIPLSDLRMAVLVQEMIHSDVSGILFYRAASENDPANVLLIEAVHGLGDRLASGLETPARYLFSQTTGCLDSSDPYNEILTASELQQLQSIAISIRKTKTFNLDIEFAIQNGVIFVLQCRPLTSICSSMFEKQEPERFESIQGNGASPGIVCGRIFLSTEKPIPGGILFDRMTTPDMLPLIREAAGIITQQGGLTCHAAIVSRELGKPCVVGIGTSKNFFSGELVTINGTKGWVRRGDHSNLVERLRQEDRQLDDLETDVKLYLNISVPDVGIRSTGLHAEGIGLLRLEFLYAHALHSHPLALSSTEFESAIEFLERGLASVCRAFAPRRVMIRMCDFKTNEYRRMPEGERYESREENPMIGWRGCMRLLSEPNKRAFALEIELLKRLSKTNSNFDIMIPFVRSAAELEALKEKLSDEGIDLTKHRLICLIETVSCVFDLTKILSICDGVSIGSNDLYQLYFGLDRDNEVFQEDYFVRYDLVPSKNLGFLALLRYIIKTCREHQKSVGICGQATSFDKDLISFLVQQKIDYISCPPNAFYYVKRQIVLEEHGEIP